MSRIRSVHPGLFTDEAFASLSMSARVLLIGIWTECDDHGVFAWKPITLKMKIMPVDNVDVAALLEELEDASIIMPTVIDGRDYGLVRNFCKYQRPKFPKFTILLNAEQLSFVSSTAAAAVIDGDQPPPISADRGKPPADGAKEEAKEEAKKKKKEDAAGAAPPPYAFEAGTIRLNSRDLEKWRKAFSYLDLEAELIALDQWASGQKDWFHAISGALAKRNRELKLRSDQSQRGQTELAVDPRL